MVDSVDAAPRVAGGQRPEWGDLVDSVDAALRVAGGQHPDTLSAPSRGERLQTCRERAPRPATSIAVGPGQANVHEIVELELPDSVQLRDTLLHAQKVDDFAETRVQWSA